jgi:hypothetical protein
MMSRQPATTISATATVRVRGIDSPAVANAVTAMLAQALSSAMRGASSVEVPAVPAAEA